MSSYENDPVSVAPQSSFVGKTFGYEMRDGTLVFVHSHHAPDPKEWADYVGFIGRTPLTGVVVFAPRDCPGPDGAQRQQLTTAQNEAPHRFSIALVTNSPLLRAILTTLHYLGRSPTRAFSPKEVDAAIQYAGVPRSRTTEYLGIAHRIASRLGNFETLQDMGLPAA